MKIIRTLGRRIRFIIAMTSLIVVALCYQAGTRQGLDTRITYGFEHDAWSMSVAISRIAYGLHEGYVGYREVVRVTSAVLAPDGVHDKSSVPFLKDPASIQKALDEGIAIDLATLPEYTPALGGHFVTIAAEDVGLADFYTLAFMIFGFHADAMYKL